MNLPNRRLDTMTDAIALSSPSGRMSKRGKAAATERLRRDLFGSGLANPEPKQPGKSERLLQEARELRDLAGRGMKPQAYLKRAKELEREAREVR